MAPSFCHQSKRLFVHSVSRNRTLDKSNDIKPRLSHLSSEKPNSTSARIYRWMTHVLCSRLQKQLLQPPKVSYNRKFTSVVAYVSSSLTLTQPPLLLSHIFPITSKLPSTPAPLNRLNFRLLFALSHPAFPLLPKFCICPV